MNWIPKIIVHFYFLRVYLGFGTVSSRMLKRMVRMDVDWDLKTWSNQESVWASESKAMVAQ